MIYKQWIDDLYLKTATFFVLISWQFSSWLSTPDNQCIDLV